MVPMVLQEPNFGMISFGIDLNIMKKLAHKGFTLIEVLLYISLVGVIVLSMSAFVYAMRQSQNKTNTITEVEQQGVQVMQTITQTVRNAISITTPTTGTSGATLTLSVNGPTTNTFDLSSGVMRITQGASPAVSLTNSRVTASALTFSNLSTTGSYGTVKIQFTLSYNNTAGRNEFNYSETFYGSATIRQ
jgi:prepilin-type N-terminal cleavage/methylation domain-containing protein